MQFFMKIFRSLLVSIWFSQIIQEVSKDNILLRVAFQIFIEWQKLSWKFILINKNRELFTAEIFNMHCFGQDSSSSSLKRWNRSTRIFFYIYSSSRLRNKYLRNKTQFNESAYKNQRNYYVNLSRKEKIFFKKNLETKDISYNKKF